MHLRKPLLLAVDAHKYLDGSDLYVEGVRANYNQTLFQKNY